MYVFKKHFFFRKSPSGGKVLYNELFKEQWWFWTSVSSGVHSLLAQTDTSDTNECHSVIPGWVSLSQYIRLQSSTVECTVCWQRMEQRILMNALLQFWLQFYRVLFSSVGKNLLLQQKTVNYYNKAYQPAFNLHKCQVGWNCDTPLDLGEELEDVPGVSWFDGLATDGSWCTLIWAIWAMQISVMHRYTVHIYIYVQWCTVQYGNVSAAHLICEECYRLPSQGENLIAFFIKVGFRRIGAIFNFFAKSSMKNKKDPNFCMFYVDSTQQKDEA